MVMINAKYDGTCAQCKQLIKKGEKCAVEKGKQPLCAKCAPPDTKKPSGFPPRPALTPWDEYAKEIVGQLVGELQKEHDQSTVVTCKSIAARAANLADAMMAERAKRGMK
jgi:hypothetical protein